MEDMYNSEFDYKDEPSEDDERIPTQRYISSVDKLFRGYAYLNLGALMFAAIITTDILAGGGNLTIFGPITSILGDLVPFIGAYNTAGVLGALLDTTSIISLLLVLAGLLKLRTGKKLSEGITFSRTRLIGDDDEQQERVIRQLGYINYGTVLLPIAIAGGVLFGGIALFALTTFAP